MSVDRNDKGQTYGGFSCCNSDREDYKHHACQRFRMGTIAPERDEIEVCCVEHQLDANNNENCITASKRDSESDGKEKSGDKKIAGQWSHLVSLFSRMASETAPTRATVKRTPMISSGST